jgi:predicted ATPase
MNGSSDDVQTLLKVMACCGTSTEESVIGHLSESTEYPGLRDGLERAVSDGFVEKDDDGNFKFCHDKIREAAYDLIPDKEKNEVSCFVLLPM